MDEACTILVLDRTVGGAVPKAKVDITVKRGARVVDQKLQRPVRVLPGGAAGVAYHGRVYPLRRDHSIDLEDAARDKSQCPGFVEKGRPIPYAASRRSSVSEGYKTCRVCLTVKRPRDFRDPNRAVCQDCEGTKIGRIRGVPRDLATDDGYVYITAGGSVWHYDEDCTARRAGQAEAAESGYRLHRVERVLLWDVEDERSPCKVCAGG